MLRFLLRFRRRDFQVTLTDLALANRVDEVDLFACVAPDQKTRVVKALQTRGHVVGFLGDGINDEPRISDCGIVALCRWCDPTSHARPQI